MCRKSLLFVSLMILIIYGCDVKAESFSILPTHDAYVSNDTDHSPDSIHSGEDGIHIRDISSRRRVGFMAFDISGLKSGDGTFTNVSLSIDCHNAGDISLYGVKEELDSINVDTLSWNTAPGVQNNPTPARESPVELDLEDLVGPLMTFQVVSGRGSTETSQALADFLNSDTDGIVVFLLAPPEAGDSAIIYTIEETPAGEHATFLEGDFVKAVGFATDPQPINGDGNVVRDVILSWTPGYPLQTHNVYLGTDFDDVNDAGIDSPLLVGPALSTNSYNAGQREYSQTYFWRVDEIDAPPASTVYKGKVWSFTVEPFAITIPEESITATASSQAEGQGPEQTVNRSGLDADDLHLKDTSTMWLTAADYTGPIWIKYEFDKPHKLYEMLVWNYNGETILSLYGLKDVIVEYSMDDLIWTQIEGLSQFTQAPGAVGYAAGDVVAFDGVAARYVRINATSIWGSGIFGSDRFGLSEVQFHAIPVSASFPSPDDAALDVAVDVILDWRAGREVAEHKLYFSEDQQAVMDGTAFVDTLSQTSYGPLALNLGSVYYWSVEEVNSIETPANWIGDIWSFTTTEYRVVEDFESYNDIDPGQEGSNRVYITWIDGYVDPPAVRTNGSTMGYPSPVFADDEHFVETTIVHGGAQSAPIFYDNTIAGISEVTVNTNDLASGSDWTVGSPETLVLWFYGDPNNPDTEQMYVKVDDVEVTYDGELTQTEWVEWSIDLAALGTDLSNVATLSIGFKKTGATGGSGVVFVDDIWLKSALEE